MSLTPKPPSHAPDGPFGNSSRPDDEFNHSDDLLQPSDFEDLFALNLPDDVADFAGGLAALQSALLLAVNPARQSDPQIRQAAVQALGHLGGTAALPILQASVKHDHASEVKTAASVAIRRIEDEEEFPFDTSHPSDLPGARLVGNLQVVLSPAAMEELEVILPVVTPSALVLSRVSTAEPKGAKDEHRQTEAKTPVLPESTGRPNEIIAEVTRDAESFSTLGNGIKMGDVVLEPVARLSASTSQIRYSLNTDSTHSFKSADEPGRAFELFVDHTLKCGHSLRVELVCHGLPPAENIRVRLVDATEPGRWQSPWKALKRYGDDFSAVLLLGRAVLEELSRLGTTSLMLAFAPPEA